MIVYDYYRLFYYVAKYGSLTRAAQVLKNSQSNLTRAMKNLENELGCQLFIRSHQGVSLTPEGEELYKHVTIAFEHIRIAEEQIIQQKNLQTGTISIGVTETALHVLLLPELESFHGLYPQVKIHIENYTTPQAIQALKSGIIDFAIVTTPLKVSKPLKSTVLTSFEEVLIAGKKYQQLRDKQLSFQDLLTYPLIGLNNKTMTYQFYANLFLKYQLHYHLDIEVATVDQILPLVTHQLGIAFIPKIFIQNNQYDSIIRLHIMDKIPQRQICLVKNTEFPLGIASLKFENMLKLHICHHQKAL